MTKVARTFTRDFMEDNDYPYELTDLQHIDDRRWYSVWTGVFEFEGKHYRVHYSSPATEMQEEDPWNDETEIVAYEVVKLPVVKYEWIEVDI
jgi:hypothetical protein